MIVGWGISMRQINQVRVFIIAAMNIVGCLWGMLLYSDYDIQTYKKAVESAQKTLPVAYPIWAAVPWNENTVWDEDYQKILAVTWIPAQYTQVYADKVGQDFETSKDFDMWVTLVPQVKNFCEDFGEKMGGVSCLAMKGRLSQFLGLPPLNYGPYPKTEYNGPFVEFWVDPQYLSRPCLTPDVASATCYWDSNISKYKNWDLDRMFRVAHVPAQHREWYKRNIEKAYPGMAWTRLGYTYDWGPSDEQHEGATELIVQKGAPITIKAVIPLEQYCPCVGVGGTKSVEGRGAG